MWIFPMGAAVVSGIFSALLIQQWLQKSRPHHLAWSIALLMFAVASFAAAIGVLDQWSPGLFRTFYLLGAILNVPVLAVGTIYLLGPRRAGHVVAAAVVVASIYAAGAVLTATVAEGALSVPGIPSSTAVLAAGEGVRALSRYFSTIGFAVVVGGALWSAWRLARSRVEQLRRLALGNVLIASGTAVVAGASRVIRLSGSEGAAAAFSVGLLAGVVLMFAGFLTTRARPVAPSDEREPVE